MNNKNNKGVMWTPNEVECLRLNYGKSTQDELLLLFPNRTWHSIEKKKLSLKLKKEWPKNWTNTQIEYLKKHIKKLGKKQCALNLNKPIDIINKKIKDLGIIIELKKPIALKNFQNVQTKEMAYILGFLWSDGYLKIKGNSYTIAIELILSDIKSIKKHFLKIGKWKFYTRKRDNRQEQGCLSITNKEFGVFLQECDFKEKSFKSADKILKKIPDNLKNYFFLGLIDGDGSWIDNKSCSKQFKLASSYDQDWSYFENLLKTLNIKYTIERNIFFHKKSKSINKHSVVRICNRSGIIKLGNYVYQTYTEDKIGLPRKFKTFSNISNINIK